MPETARGAHAILEGLTRAQREAVTHLAGPLLIIAGAGTGKTTVITRRIAHLIATRQARPSEVLALTFTDKAAAEMEERVDQLVPYGYADVQIATFHAFGDRLIKENALELGLTPDFRVLTRAEQVIFVRDHLFEFPLKHFRPLGDPTRHIQAMITLFSRLKDEDVGADEYLTHADTLRAAAADDAERLEAEEQGELARTYAQYQTLMARLGQIDFGENKVQEALPKMDQTADLPIRWHLVGHLQSNKAKKAGRFDVVHSVDSAALMSRLDEAAQAARKIVELLVQVDLAGEATKHGAREDDVAGLFDAARPLAGIRLVGLMLLPPAVEEPEQVRPFFRRLRDVREQLLTRGIPASALNELSMGMSHDFEVAVEEGATLVRVGTAIFGGRSVR